MDIAFTQIKAAIVKRQHHRRISMRFIHVSKNRKLNAAFRAWHSNCTIMKRNRIIVKKICTSHEKYYISKNNASLD